MKHLWLFLALLFLGIGTVRLISMRAAQPPSGTTSPTNQVAQASPIPAATRDPCQPPADVSDPRRWWLGCWDTNAAGDWSLSAPVLYFDGSAHRFATPEEYIAKLTEFRPQGSDPEIVDSLVKRFEEVIRQRHPLSVERVAANKWIVTIPKGQWYDTGIRITANMIVDVHGDEGFQAKIGNHVFSADEIVLNNGYAIGVSLNEKQVENLHPGWAFGSEKFPGIAPDFVSTLKLQVNEKSREWLKLTVDTKPD
jgi:hypothetical protein